MAKKQKKVALTILTIYGMLFPRPMVGQENLPITIFRGIDQVGKQLIQMNRQNQSRKNPQTSQYAPKSTSSKYFPQCKINAAKNNFPENVCRSDLATEQRRAKEAQGFKNIAIQNISFLENLLTEGQESLRPQGIQCLKDASIKKLSDIQNVINRLKLESINIKQGFEEFNEQASNTLAEMRKINAELIGGKPTLDGIKKDFSQEFSPACRDILTAEFLSQGNRTGLVGIRDNSTFVKKYDLANRAYSNEDIWKQELLSKIKKIKDRINRFGPGALDPKTIGTIFDKSDPTMDNSIIIASVKSYQEFKNEYDSVNSKMQQNLGYTLPPLDQNFYQNLSRFSQSSKTYFRKKLVHQCVTGERYDLALDLKKILKGVRQSNATTRGTNVINYRNQLRKILNQDSFFEDKMAAIRKLDKSYGGTIVYRYRDNKTGLTSKPPSEIFKDTIKNCRRQVVQDNTFSRNPSNQGNNVSNIVQADQELKELSKKARTLSHDIAKDIYDRVANCNGKGLKAGSCNEKTLNSDSEGFCIAHAASCANAVRSCHREVSEKITVRTNSIKALATQWDDSVKTFVQKQKNYLNNYLFPPVMQIMEQIRKHLPGATAQYDADTFIKTPLPTNSDEFGITMLGGANLEELQQLPSLIEKNLIGMLEEQKEKLGQEYNRYIDQKQRSIETEKSRWATLRKNCEKLESKISQAAEKMNKAKQEQFSQQRAAAGEFCAKYSLLRQNPAAGCGEGENSVEKLYTDSFAVAGMLDPNVAEGLNHFMEYCAQYNNESTEGSEDENDPPSTLRQLCQENDHDLQESISDMAATTVPEDHEDSVREYLKKKDRDPALINKLSRQQQRNLKNLHRTIHPDEDEHNIMQNILEDLVSSNITTRSEAATHLNGFKDWKGDNAPLTLEDLSQIAESNKPQEDRKSFFREKDLEEIITMVGFLKDAKLKSDTNNLCQKHTNFAAYYAAKECKRKDKKCFERELDETESLEEFSSIERSLSKLRRQSQAISAQGLGEQVYENCLAPIGNEAPRQSKPSMFDLLFPDQGDTDSSRGLGI